MGSRYSKFATVFSIVAAGAVTMPATGFAQEEPQGEPTTETPAEKPEQPAEPAAGEAEEPADTPKGVTSESDLTAEQRVQYEAHLRAGKAAYANQNFDLAFNELKRAYGIYAKPSILFNIALIAEKGGALERSVEYYRKFLNAPGVTLENRQRASDRLAAVQQILETSSSAEEARQKQQVTDLLPALEAMGIDEAMAPAETTNATANTTTTTTNNTQGTATTTTPTETDGEVEVAVRPDVDYRWPVYASFGTATAALVGGVVMVAMTNKRIDEGKAAGQAGDDAGLAAAEEDASMYATTATGLFIGGAVLSVVGAYFVVRNSQNAEEEMNAQSSPDGVKVGVSLHKNFLGPILSFDF